MAESFPVWFRATDTSSRSATPKTNKQTNMKMSVEVQVPSYPEVKVPANPDAHKHFQQIAESLFHGTSFDYDVRLHCTGGRIIQANKQNLSLGSVLLKSIFGSDCSCASYIPVEYDIICPDFNPELVRKVVGSLQNGRLTIGSLSEEDLQEIQSILFALQINIPYQIVESSSLEPIEEIPTETYPSVQPYQNWGAKGPTEPLEFMNPDQTSNYLNVTVARRIKAELSADGCDQVDMVCEGQLGEEDTSFPGVVQPPGIFPDPLSMPGRSFSTSTSQKSKSKKQFRCKFCGNGFVSQTNVDNHVQTMHKNSLPHACPKCPRHYATLEDLEAHDQEVHHLTLNLSQSQDNPGMRGLMSKSFRCETCLQDFFKKSDLFNHILRTHKNPKGIFKCPNCYSTFTQQKHLVKHMKTIHQNQFSNRDPLRSHLAAVDQKPKPKTKTKNQKPFEC